MTMRTTIIDKTCQKIREDKGPAKRGETRTVCEVWCGSQECPWHSRVIETRGTQMTSHDSAQVHRIVLEQLT